MPHPEAASPKRPRPAAPGGPGFDPRVPSEAAARRVSSREDGDFYSTSAAFIGPLLRPPGRTGSAGSTAGSTAPSGDAGGGLDAELRQFYREIEELEHPGEDRRGAPGTPDPLRAPHGHADPLRAPPGPWEHPDPVSTVSPAPTATVLDGEHHREDRRGDPLRAPPGSGEHQDPGCQKLLILLRGLPGSGKTTLSRALLGRSRGAGVVCSADDYFRDGGGYRYRVSRLGDAHGWSQSRARRAMAEGRSPVIIDNTNTQAWEMRPYVEMAIGEGYRVEFQEPETWWKFDPEELEKRNQHGVSRKKIARMLARYDFQVSLSTVMTSVAPDRPLPARPGPRWGPPRPGAARPGAGDPPGDQGDRPGAGDLVTVRPGAGDLVTVRPGAGDLVTVVTVPADGTRR